MLGLRGCRLGITMPEITRMQARAIIEAACELAKEGKKIVPEIMIPLVGMVSEMKAQKDLIREVGAGDDEAVQREILLSRRDHDRTAARRRDGRSHCGQKRSSSHSGRTTSLRPRSVSPATMRRSSSIFIERPTFWNPIPSRCSIEKESGL